MSALKHITTVLCNGTIPVHKYKSELTGLTIVIAEVKGPLVNGFFTLGKHKGNNLSFLIFFFPYNIYNFLAQYVLKFY